MKTKLPKQIRIIADRPASGQSSIAGWIGQTFPVDSCSKDDDNKFDGRVTVLDESGGPCVIQPEEYEVVQ